MNKSKFLRKVTSMTSVTMRTQKIALGLLLSMSLCIESAAVTDYKALSKELEVMNGVMATTLKQVCEDVPIQIQGLSTRYLAGQGVVYNIPVANKNRYVRFSDRIVVPAPATPAMPHGSESNIRMIEKIEHMHIEDVMEHAMEEIEIAFSRDSQHLRELKSSVRNLAWKLREVQRLEQDLTFELQTADEERKKVIEEEVAKLEEKNKSIIKQKLKLLDKANKIEEIQKQKKETQKAELAKINESFIKAFEENVSNNLCRYGAGLRALPKNEHITFILDDFNGDVTDGNSDRIYVFKASDVTKCVQDKIDVKELLSSATVYDF